jgi:uncharacterized membrane-anchored protein YhcB (DUF1043 family)
MKKEYLNRTLWISGLITGVFIGAYLYRNQKHLAPQQKKIKSLIDDLKKTASELSSQALKVGQEQLEASKALAKQTIESVKKTS